MRRDLRRAVVGRVGHEPEIDTQRDRGLMHHPTQLAGTNHTHMHPLHVRTVPVRIDRASQRKLDTDLTCGGTQ